MSGLMNPATKTLRLLQPHRHQGRDYPVGGMLEMSADRADWLIGIGRAEPVPAEPKKPAKE